MKKVLLLILLAVVLFSIVGVLIDYLVAVPLEATATYVGSATCAECHQQSFNRWHGSPHDRAMDLATSETVLGDFEDASLTYQGIHFADVSRWGTLHDPHRGARWRRWLILK